MEWIIQNSGELLQIVTAVVTIASVVANLTPSEADNKIVNAVIRFVNMLGLNIKKNL